MDDTLALKTLQNIEKLLKSAMSGTTQKTSIFSMKGMTASRDKADKDALKYYTALAVNLKDTNDAVLGLNKSLISLNTEVGKTTIGFGSLNSSMAKFMKGLAVEPAKPVGGVSAPAEKRGAVPKAATAPAVQGLAKEAQQAQAPNLNHQAAAIMDTVGKGLGTGIKPVTKQIQDMKIPFAMTLGHMIDGFSKAGVAGYGLETVLADLFKVGQKLAVDFFRLSATGLGSATNLGTLYVNAALAGMSLKEYTKVIDDNISVAARSGSLDEFDKLIGGANGQLAKMGIFGADATELSGTLAQAAVMSGVQFKDLGSSISGQIGIFDELHKTTNMTAEAFGKLVLGLSDNEQVQKELLGLAPGERAARMQEITQIATTGQKMGLTAEASAKLAAALIDQRKATVVERIDQGGALLQALGFLGMGDQSQRAMQLNLKGQNRTAPEEEEFRQLQGSVDQALAQRYQTGNLGDQHVVDVLRAQLGSTSVGKVMEANRSAVLAQQSKTVTPEQSNKDFHQYVGEFGQFVGQLTAWARGFAESIGPAVGAALSGILLVAFRGVIGKALSGIVGKFIGGGAEAGAVVGEAAEAGAATAEAVGSVLKPFELLRTGLGIVADWFPMASGLISGAIELFTGTMATALNPSGGFFNRLGGIVSAFFSGIPEAVFSVAQFFLGPTMLQPIKNGFDIVVAFMNMAIKDFLARFVGGVADLLSFLPEDSGLLTMVRGARDSLQNSAQENAVTVEKLWNDQSQTLKTLAATTEKGAEKSEKTAQVATVKATAAQSKFNDVQMASTLTAAGVVADAKQFVANPQVQVPQPIAPATVNSTPDQAAAAAAAAQTDTTAAANTPDMTTLLTAMLQVLRDGLSAEQRQADNSDVLVKQLSRSGAVFDSSEQAANRLLRTD